MTDDVCSYIVKRTQIHVDEKQDELLAERAAEQGRTKSDLIREALDLYLAGPADTKAARLQRFRDAVTAAAGSAPYLPSGAEYVRELREADRARDEALEAHWRR